MKQSWHHTNKQAKAYVCKNPAKTTLVAAGVGAAVGAVATAMAFHKRH